MLASVGWFVATLVHWLCVLPLVPVVLILIVYNEAASIIRRWRRVAVWNPSDTMGEGRPTVPLDMASVTLESVFVTSSDGTRLAVDVWLPPGVTLTGDGDKKVPCVFHQSRYYRSTRLWWPFCRLINAGKPFNFICHPFFKSFLYKNMAIVSYDVRGSGASFGLHRAPWVERERMDADAFILNCTFERSLPWFNGKLALWGISYEGMAAFHTVSNPEKQTSVTTTLANVDTNELKLGGNMHKLDLRACCPMYCFWDTFSELGFPGGVSLHCFTRNWFSFTNNLDKHTIWMTSLPAFIAFRSVTPVEKDTYGLWNAALASARREHNNWKALEDLPVCDTRDQLSATTGLCAEDISLYSEVHNLLERAVQSNGQLICSNVTPLADFLHFTGWYDSGVTCALKAAMYIGRCNHIIVIGPWTHGGNQHVRLQPNTNSGSSKFPFAEFVSQFFAHKLNADPPKPGIARTMVKNVIIEATPTEASAPDVQTDYTEAWGLNKVAYYVINENVWKFVPEFPFSALENGRRFFFSGTADTDPSGYVSFANRRTAPHLSLHAVCPSTTSPNDQVTLTVNPRRDKGYEGVSRWRSMTDLFTPVKYNLDHSSLNHIRFTSPPLDTSIEVTGYPLVSLRISSPRKNATVFVYLQCIHETGAASYVTEGCLRLCFHSTDAADPAKKPVNTCVHHFPTPFVPQRSFTLNSIDMEPLLEPTDITFELMPISFMFFSGQRVRVSLFGADVDNFGFHETESHPIQFHFNESTFIKLPVVREVAHAAL